MGGLFVSHYLPYNSPVETVSKSKRCSKGKPKVKRKKKGCNFRKLFNYFGIISSSNNLKTIVN